MSCEIGDFYLLFMAQIGHNLPYMLYMSLTVQSPAFCCQLTLIPCSWDGSNLTQSQRGPPSPPDFDQTQQKWPLFPCLLSTPNWNPVVPGGKWCHYSPPRGSLTLLYPLIPEPGIEVFPAGTYCWPATSLPFAPNITSSTEVTSIIQYQRLLLLAKATTKLFYQTVLRAAPLCWSHLLNTYVFFLTIGLTSSPITLVTSHAPQVSRTPDMFCLVLHAPSLCHMTAPDCVLSSQ